MKYQKVILAVLFCSIFSVISCHGQNTNQIVGGPCQGCEALFEYGSKKLTTVDTLPDFANLPAGEAGAKLKLKLTGTVFKKDGKTPAKNVILYIYHTNRQGIYAAKSNAKGWAKRHGYLRGWVKTDETGRYTFYTFRPGAYPNRAESEHIHLTVKEPSKNEYYMDSFAFDDDPLLTIEKRKRLEKRGGSGIVKPTLENGIITCKRDIILGAHIPNYE
ncbi:intradiol ring-cleavage dioxygenase [Dokdonia sp.]|uniref:dioxygenase family protein n=1 Tax=Dokdonia sp. TaxID=2024995 RepID=UPI0032675F34